MSFQEVNWHVGPVMGSSDHNEMEGVTGGFLQWLLVAGEVLNSFLKCGVAGIWGAIAGLKVSLPGLYLHGVI